MLECLNLSYKLQDRYLFKDISFTALPGSFIIIEGPNGSGKTSLLRMIAGLIPTEGNILLNNYPIDEIKPLINYIGHNLALKLELSVISNLTFWAEIYDSPELIPASLHYFNLYEHIETKIIDLSEGQKRKVALAKLLACHSDIWLLDEVDSNLDNENLSLLNNLIQTRVEQGGIVIFSTHHPERLKKKHSINLLDYAEKN